MNTTYQSLKNFSPDAAIHLWWNDKTRRPTQSKKSKRKDGSTSSTLDNSTEDDSGEENEFMLEDWDQWLTDTPN